jgi:hypothetical protein
MDEMWLHHYAPESKCQEYGMGTSKITSQEEVKNPTISGKSDVDTFWDAQGPLLEHCPERGTRVNCVHFSKMFWNQLK